MEANPTTLTYHLEASAFGWDIAPGKTVPAWGFNQQVPGPVLKAKKGGTLVVRVKNSLREPTLVHWHGIRLPAVMDGTGHGLDEPVKVGELQVWEIKNRTLVHHPFHLHGFFFQVLELNGQASGYLAWKDVFHIPPSGTLKIAWMPDNRPGMWMYHCPVLEHHATGMMASFEVIDGSKPAGIAQPDHVARYRMYVPLYPWPTKGSNILYLDSNMNNIALEFGIGVQII